MFSLYSLKLGGGFTFTQELSSNAKALNYWWRRRDSNSQQSACKAGALPVVLHPQIVVRQERLELSILAALASKTNVYTIPPLTHNHIVIAFVYYTLR